MSVAGNDVPVSCTNPLNAISQTTASGALDPNFTIVAGTVGPPATGNDSAGHDGATDAALYPCPPTTAQVAAGATCQINFGDATGKSATVNIAFVPAPTAATTTTTTAGAAAASGTGATSSGTNAATPTTASSLAFTGAGPDTWLTILGGLLLLDLGFLVLTLYYRPRELAAMVGRGTGKLFGGK
jgi:hypothetical protein